MGESCSWLLKSVCPSCSPVRAVPGIGPCFSRTPSPGAGQQRGHRRGRKKKGKFGQRVCFLPARGEGEGERAGASSSSRPRGHDAPFHAWGRRGWPCPGRSGRGREIIGDKAGQKGALSSANTVAKGKKRPAAASHRVDPKVLRRGLTPNRPCTHPARPHAHPPSPHPPTPPPPLSAAFRLPPLPGTGTPPPTVSPP